MLHELAMFVRRHWVLLLVCAALLISNAHVAYRTVNVNAKISAKNVADVHRQWVSAQIQHELVEAAAGISTDSRYFKMLTAEQQQLPVVDQCEIVTRRLNDAEDGHKFVINSDKTESSGASFSSLLLGPLPKE